MLFKTDDNHLLDASVYAGQAVALGRMMSGGGARERRENDYYPTEPEPIDAFIDAEKSILDFFRWNQIRVWENACGCGAISRKLEAFGLEVLSTDLIYRGYGQGGLDFLKSSGPIRTPIITNPPYGDFPLLFIEHALSLQVPYLALLLKSNFFHSGKHAAFFDRCPPTREYRLSWRLDFTGEKKPTMTFTWFVWDFITPRASRSPDVFSLHKPTKPNNQREMFDDI